VWVIYSIGDKQDSDETTDDVGITMMGKERKKLGPANSQVDKRKKREITLQKELTDHPLNTYLALSLQYAQAMDKSKCWVCSHLPHSSKHGLPLFTIPLKGEDMCGYLVRRQDRPVLTKVKKDTSGSTRENSRDKEKLEMGGTIVQTMSTGITPNIVLLKCMS